MAGRRRSRSDGHRGDASGVDDRRDDGRDPPCDRQVLLVGDGIGVAVAAGFLDRAGLDPVVASPARDRPLPPVVLVWRSGLDLLERIGLRRPIERRGTAPTRFVCRTRERCWVADAGDRPSLVAIDRPRLDEVLDRRPLDRVRTVERPVTAVTPTDRGVRVTFERGVDEPFDAVLTTSRRVLPGTGTTDSPAVHRWTFRWPAGTPAPDVPTQAWDERGAAFTVPTAETTFVTLVTVAGTAPAAVDAADLDDRFGHLFPPSATPFAGDERPAIQYERTPFVSPASLSTDGVGRFGAAARASIPGDRLGTALTVEDAWVLADEMASGSGTVTERLARYERRRRRRDADVVDACTTTDAASTLPLDPSPPIRRLIAARTAALAPLLRSTPEPIPPGGPDRL